MLLKSRPGRPTASAVVLRRDILARAQHFPRSNPAPTKDALRFTGKERDEETGLDYFGARYYGCNAGRFTTTDPLYTWEENLLDPQRWNRYAYVRNNPLRYTDPDGRGIVSKIGKFIFKGGDFAATFKGVVDDALVLFSLDVRVGTGPRIIATLSLASELLPVSGRDVKEGAELALT